VNAELRPQFQIVAQRMIAADVVEIDASALADIAAEARAQKLTAELRREAEEG
jgi:hypothetical protein